MIYVDHCDVHKFYEKDIENAPLEGGWRKDNQRKITYIVYSKNLKPEVK